MDDLTAGSGPSSPLSSSGPEALGPLHGVVVADFSRVLAGPLATMLLGDLGATVVKVEHPRGDDTRHWGPPFAGGETTYYLSVNRNKRSVVLDLAAAEGLDAARRLAHRCTVLVENFRPGRLASFGLGYDDLAASNPGLVYCSISGFGGVAGAGAELVGYDFVVQAMSGLMDITGPEGGPASKVGVAVVDVLTGLYAAIGILAALRHRDQTGSGQRVEVDLMSSALAALVNQASGYLNAAVVPRAMGNRHPSVAPYETLAARDGAIAIAAGNDAQFRALCVVLDTPTTADDARFQTNADRVQHRHELVVILEERLARRTVAEWVPAIRASGVACGPVNDVAAAFADAERVGLRPVVSFETAAGVVSSVANPLRLSSSPLSYRRPPPSLGEDDDEVLGWLRASGEGPPLDQ